jgi:hypothetical protein
MMPEEGRQQAVVFWGKEGGLCSAATLLQVLEVWRERAGAVAWCCDV